MNTFLYQGAIRERYGLKNQALVLSCIISLALLILASKIQVPMVPVPITFQTAVVLLLPALLGTVPALGVLFTYFGLGMLGVPVFAMAAGAIPGPLYFIGPTAGYLVGFACAMVGIGMALSALKSKSFFGVSLVMLFGHALIFIPGVLWLAYGLPSLGMQTAIASGFVPFIVGTILKSLISAAIIKSLPKANAST